MKLLTTIWNWLKRRLTKGVSFRSIKAEELPDLLETNKIYLLGEGSYLWSAVMICPCGCKEALHMNLLADAKPNWVVTEHFDGTLTLFPSIWRKVGCQSHFFLRRGRVIWCGSDFPSA